MYSIKIELAKPEDVRGMQEVFYRTWLATYPNKELGITVDDIEDRYKDAFTDEVLKTRAERIKDPTPGHTLFFAKDGVNVVGLCRMIETENENRLQALYVLPEYQGRGIGMMLWNAAQQVFNPNKDIYVSVATYNKNAISFYERLGFVDTGKRWTDEKYKMKNGSMIPEMDMVIKRV